MIALAEPVRTARLQVIANGIEAGGTGATLAIYGRTQPEPGGSAGAAALATFTLPDPAIADVSAATLTFAPVDDTQVSSSGTATWARVRDAAGTWIADLDAGGEGSGAAVELSDTALYTGGTLSVLSAELME